MVHGLGEHSGRYEHVGSFLASRGFDTLGFDNRGFGQSGGRRAHIDSFSEFIDDVEDLLVERRTLGVPVVLMGHSLGGLMVTAYLASERPSPDLAIISAPALQAVVPAWQRTMASLVGRVAPKVFVPSKIDETTLSRDVEVQRAYLDDPLVFGGTTAGFGKEVLKAVADTAAKVGRIQIPTYVLHGGQDVLVPTAASESLGQLPNVTRKVWPDLRHECLNEPEQADVLDGIAEWLEGQLGGSST